MPVEEEEADDERTAKSQESGDKGYKIVTQIKVKGKKGKKGKKFLRKKGQSIAAIYGNPLKKVRGLIKKKSKEEHHEDSLNLNQTLHQFATNLDHIQNQVKAISDNMALLLQNNSNSFNQIQQQVTDLQQNYQNLQHHVFNQT